MILDFTVGNFRSIKEPVTLSFVAQRGRSSQGQRKYVRKDTEICDTFASASQSVDVLPVAGIFGPNASGKSNLLRALILVGSLVVRSRQTQVGLTSFMPFRLNADGVQQPSSFALRAEVDGIYYEYAIALTAERINHESLRYLPVGARVLRVAYEADYDAESSRYVWSSQGGRGLSRAHYALRESWLGVEPFLRTFLNFDAPEVGKSGWLLNLFSTWATVGVEHDDVQVDRVFSADVLGKYAETLHRVVWMMQQCDTGVDDIEIEKDSAGNATRLIAVHRRPIGVMKWPFTEESYGTQALVPLFTKILLSLELGSLAVVDELGAHVHRGVVRMIVDLYKRRATNPRGAQLLFASHDASLLEDQFLRRDQVWFTERRSDGSTDLFPLTDFHPRNDLDLYRSYVEGRFGAVPILPSPSRLLQQSGIATAKNPAAAEETVP